MAHRIAPPPTAYRLYCQLRSSDWGTYAYFSFLSQDTLVIPNLIQNTLEIAKIVIDNDNKPRLVPLCVLGLPALTGRATIVRLACRAEPNPTGPGPLAIPAPSSRPFRDKVEDAIILFNVLIEDAHLDAELFHFPETRPFTFVVHRGALLAHVPAAQRACPPYCYSALEPDPEPAPELELELEPAQLPWAAWGPAVTRWFESDHASIRWITTTSGQRAVTMEEGPPTPIIVRDFNPYTVRSARARAAASGQSRGCNWSERLQNGNRMTLKVEESVVLAGSVFVEDVRSSLPYVEVATQAEYRYEGVLVDEERILGLKVRAGSLFHRRCNCIFLLDFGIFCRLAKRTRSGFRRSTSISWGNSPDTWTLISLAERMKPLGNL